MRSTSSAFTPTTSRPRRPGEQRRKRRWTTPTCAISSCTSIVSSIRTRAVPTKVEAMDDQAAPASEGKKSRRGGRARPMKALWRRIRQPLVRSRVLRNVVASLLVAAIRLVERTNPRVEGSHDIEKAIATYSPAIAAFWHGQHLLGPVIYPRKHRL